VLADLEIWADNPILGVGPGLAKGTRALYYERAGSNGAHTEFSRLVSEHGIFGFGALWLLIVAAFKNINRARSAKARAVTASMVGWSFLYMMNAAMRLAAPSLVFGVTFAHLLPEDRRRLRQIDSQARQLPGHTDVSARGDSTDASRTANRM